MRLKKCVNCGSIDFDRVNGQEVCRYCKSVYVDDKKIILLDKEYTQVLDGSEGIAVNSDIDRLLAKCQSDPKNTKRYANLILDIDPHNKQAKELLKKVKQ